MLVVVLELLCDLCPDVGELLLGILVGVVGEHINIDPVLMVYVQDNEHVAVDCEIHRGLDVIHPGIIDQIHFGRFIPFEMLIPGGRDTDGVEAAVLDGLEQFSGRLRITPCLCKFAGCRGAAELVRGAVQRVAQVPADGHLGYDTLRILTGERCRMDISERQRAHP